MSSHKKLKAVGYWQERIYVESETFPKKQIGWDGSEWGPYPQGVIAALGTVQYPSAVSEYLRAGTRVVSWRGLSNCRLDCGASHREMGNACLSDGEWIWPEGLVHYVEWHEMPLPSIFVETILGKHNAQLAATDWTNLEIEYDGGYWNEWFEALSRDHEVSAAPPLWCKKVAALEAKHAKTFLERAPWVPLDELDCGCEACSC